VGLFKRRRTSRPPLADLDSTSVDVSGHTFALKDALVAARVEGNGLQVAVFHPDFVDLSEELRAEGSVEILIATLGEDALRVVVSQLDPATHPPIDPFGLGPLRDFVRSLGIPIEPGES
jgi:hypothetical protein